MSSWQQALGAIVRGDATQFRVWAPEVECVEVMLETPGPLPARFELRGPVESGPPGAVIFWSRCAIVEEE